MLYFLKSYVENNFLKNFLERKLSLSLFSKNNYTKL